MPNIPIRKPGYSMEYDSWFIPLTQGFVALVDADMVPILSQNNWCACVAECARSYAARYIVRDGKRTSSFMHREVTSAPKCTTVDHRKHYPLSEKLIDNRRANLRVCTHSENMRNLRPQVGRSSAYKGVCWHSRDRRWLARIQIQKKLKYIGSFADEQEAARAYDAAAVKYHGEFALTNKAAGLLQGEAA